MKLPSTFSIQMMANATLAHWKGASIVLPCSPVMNVIPQLIMGLACWISTFAAVVTKVVCVEDTTCPGIPPMKVVLQCVEMA